MNEYLLFQAITIVCATGAFVASLRFVRRYLELRNERLLQNPPDGVTARLERMEATIDATALEIERLAEANRFMAKVLVERDDPSRLPNSRPERVITPH